MKKLKICPSTLAQGFETYSPKALRNLFFSRKVPHLLPYYITDVKREQRNLLNENRTRISISGVQEKYSLKQEKRELILSIEGGTHILKPIPTALDQVENVPANEHLTMQIALQVYQINVANNGLIFFEDGDPAYITKRFDVLPNGKRSLKEDFASLLQKTSEGGNKYYKYEGSYLDIAYAIDTFLPASLVFKEVLFRLIVFNYLFSNGDAHLKNFSVIDYYQDGYYQLSPAYDLICTRLHVDDSDIALNDGLYKEDYLHPSYTHYGFYAYDDFYDFGLKIGLLPNRIKKIMHLFLSKTAEVESLLQRSFLANEMKEKYLQLYQDKLTRLRKSLGGRI